MDRAADKKRQLEEQKRKWMLSRENDLSKSVNSMQELAVGVYDGVNIRSNATSSNMQYDSLKAEISDQIRKEISKELLLQRNISNNIDSGAIGQTTLIAKNLEQYVLHTEAHSHTCKICFELMISPNRTPMFLYPCGHTFCKTCMNTHTKQSQDPTCPYCRKPIQNMIINQAIKEIIDNYMEQKAQVFSPFMYYIYPFLY